MVSAFCKILLPQFKIFLDHGVYSRLIFAIRHQLSMDMTENYIHWNSGLYEQKHAFVYQYGEALVQLLAPQSGERILDLGCGTGQLTAMIAKSGAHTVGIDASAEMITQAKCNFPDLNFQVMDASDLKFSEPFDAIFSNATLHWLPAAVQASVAKGMYQCLRPGGRLVAEFGGKGNNEKMIKALKTILTNKGYILNADINFWYFPSISEYTTLLEEQGFEVIYAAVYPRATELSDPENGVKEWFRMFGEKFFVGMPEHAIEEVLDMTQALLSPTHFREGKWFADYKRIRIVAIKPGD